MKNHHSHYKMKTSKHIALICFTVHTVSIILFLILASFPISGTGQDFKLTRHFTTKDGLASMICKDGFMDAKGYMWISTANGLSRYDGHRFKNFHHQPDDITSLCWNDVRGFYQDDEKYLWVATDNGLAQFDYTTEKWKCFHSDLKDSTTLSGNKIYNIYKESKNSYWIATHSAGLNLFDQSTNQFKRFPLKKGLTSAQENWKHNTIEVIAQDVGDPNILWAASTSGLYQFDKARETYIKIDTINDYHALYTDRPGEVFAAYWGHGLGRYDKYTNSWDFYYPVPVGKTGYDPNGLTNVVLDIKSKGNDLYLATWPYGPVVFNRLTKQFTFLHPEAKNTKKKQDKFHANKLFFDAQERLWVFTNEGLLLYDPAHDSIPSYNIKRQKYGLENKHFVIRSIGFDVNDKAYVSTSYGDGVYALNTDYTKATPIPNSFFPNKNQNGYLISNLKIDGLNNMWAIDSRSGKLIKYNRTINKFEIHKEEEYQNLLEHRAFFPTHLIIDKKNNVWIAASEGGVIQYDQKKDTFLYYFQFENDQYSEFTSSITDMKLDSEENLWIATGSKGVFLFDTKKRCFTKTFLSDKTNAIHERVTKGVEQDNEGRIWASMLHYGIFIIDPDAPEGCQIQTLTSKDGLPSTVIYGIEKDQKGNMWILSAQGLIKYNAKQKSFKIYGLYEGISNLFDWSVPFLVTDRGEIFIGKQDGSFYFFHPDSLFINTLPPSLVFSEFRVHEEEKVFEKNINYIEKIVLPYNENFFSISFAALNYTKPEGNQYKYMLEGFDKDWKNSGNNNTAPYTDVPEGRYTFRVEAANNDGIWNEEGIFLNIHILPPWYRTWWAYLLWGGLVLSTLTFLFYIQRRRLQLHNQLEIEQKEAQRFKELDDVKSRLYTNITHEFRTPLTVIKGMSEQLQGEKRIKKSIQYNIDNLLYMINQLLDLSKLESGKMTINAVQSNIVTHIKYTVLSFQSYCNSNDINLSFYSFQESLRMDFDPKKLQQVITNLVSNAIKFTPQYGMISVALSRMNSDLSIVVKDTGIGISKEDLPFIFDRFHQVDASFNRSNEGTGIGLAIVKELVKLMDGKISVESTVEKGSTFTLLLPIRQNAALQEVETSLNPLVHLPQKHSEESVYTNEKDTDGNDKLLALIIEDNAEIREYLSFLLSNMYHIVTAQNGAKGIEQAITHIPDIIISDIMMPEKDGYQVCSILKRDHRTSHIPIILLTAKGDQQSKVQGLDKGADAYLVKPFEKEELYVRMKKLIELRKLLQQKYQKIHVLSIPEKEISENPDLQFLQQLDYTIIKRISDENFRVDPHLCRAMSMSRAQLYRKCKALKGISPADYIRKTRLQKAKELLLQTDMPIGEIATQIGFKEPSYFARMYANLYGKSPRQERSED